MVEHVTTQYSVRLFVRYLWCLKATSKSLNYDRPRNGFTTIINKLQNPVVKADIMINLY